MKIITRILNLAFYKYIMFYTNIFIDIFFIFVFLFIYVFWYDRLPEVLALEIVEGLLGFGVQGEVTQTRLA